MFNIFDNKKCFFFHGSSEKWGDLPKVTQLVVEQGFEPESIWLQPGLQAAPVSFSP